MRQRQQLDRDLARPLVADFGAQRLEGFAISLTWEQLIAVDKSDKVKGTANQVAGKVKQGVGEATDDPALKGEGKGQEAKGDLQKAVGNAKSAIKKA